MPLTFTFTSIGVRGRYGASTLPIVFLVVSNGLAAFVYPVGLAGSIARAGGSERIARPRTGHLARAKVGSLN